MAVASIAGFLFIWWWLGFLWAELLTGITGVRAASKEAAGVLIMFLVGGVFAYLLVEYGTLGILSFLWGGF